MHRCRTLLISLALLLSVAVHPAHAQFGRVLKKATASAADKTVAGAVPLRPVDQLQGLTASDLDALLKGFDAEIAAAPSARKEAEEKQKQREADRKVYAKAQADYDNAMKKYTPCRDKWSAENEAATKASDSRIQAATPAIDQAKLKELGLRAQTAAQHMQAGTATAADQQAMADLQRATMQMQQSMSGVMKEAQSRQQTMSTADARLVKACGPEPTSPTPPDGLDWDPVRVMLSKGAEASGMTEREYRIKRETAIAYRTSKVTAKSYSQPDADAINAKLDQVRDRLRTMEQAKIPL